MSDIEEQPSVQVRVLATTDLHAHVVGYDYFAGRVSPGTGLTRTATLIAQARTEAADGLCLLLDNGDSLIGAPMDMLPRDGENPVVAAFSHLGYDAIGLGNHDLELGLDGLATTFGDAPFAVVSSNLTGESVQAQTWLKRSVILERTVGDTALRIGVLSFLPPQTMEWNALVLTGSIDVEDILEAARREVSAVRDQGCDLVIALAHSGLSPAPGDTENRVIPLADIDGIDAIVAGHTHLELPGASHAGLPGVDAESGRVNGTPVVMAGAYGSHLGVIDLTLSRDDDGWSVASATCQLRSVRDDAANEDAPLRAKVDPFHQRTIDLMRRSIGQTPQSLHSYFTYFAEDRALRAVAAAQAAAIRPHVTLLDETLGLPVLSASAPCKFGGRAGPGYYTDVPAGPLSIRDIADLSPFQNVITAGILDGAAIADWLEQVAGQFAQVVPGSQGQRLIDPTVPGHDFDVIFGLEYRIDLSSLPLFMPDGTRRPDGARRVQDIRFGGQPIKPDQSFVVAMNSYRAGGGGRIAALRGMTPLPIPKIPVRDALQSFLSDAAVEEPLAKGPWPWQFLPMEGTEVQVATGPGAQAHLGEVEGNGVRAVGQDADGFLTLSLTL